MFDQFTNLKQYLQAWTICSFILFVVFYRWPGRQLDHIPAVGYKSHVLSFIEAFRFIFSARHIVQKGADQFRHSIFKVPNFSRWVVVVTGSKYIEELRRAPEDILSFHEAGDEALQMPYTFGDAISKNRYHIPVIRSQLTKNLAALFPDLQDEVSAAFTDVLSLQDHEWKKFKALETLIPIVCQTSNRIFVGAPLCRDSDYIDVNLKFTAAVVKTAWILNMLPAFLRPLIGNLLTSVPTSVNCAMKHLRPVIEKRQKEIQEHGKDYPDKPLDFLSWLMDEAKDEETSVQSLTLRILTVNFAAIHTSSMALTHALFYLDAYPEYVQPMRDEIIEVLKDEGWTHGALSRMTMVDSFIKESQRLNAISCILMGRVSRQPFTFSNGTYIPKGTTLYVGIHSTHIDEENYPNPTEFEPFRFVNKAKKEGRKVDMVSTHSDFLAFGHGRHACPGRFFAAEELKLMLAHIIVNYDVKLENEGVRPENMWVGAACVPNPRAEVMFRKRKD